MHLRDMGERVMQTNPVMETNPVKVGDPGEPPQQDSNFQSLMAAIEHSRIEVADLSAAALRGVLNGVITGEGPTTAGRVHFSRTPDPGDAQLCARILTAAGGEEGAPVTRL